MTYDHERATGGVIAAQGLGRSCRVAVNDGVKNCEERQVHIGSFAEYRVDSRVSGNGRELMQDGYYAFLWIVVAW